jgi:hypothetical protein
VVFCNEIGKGEGFNFPDGCLLHFRIELIKLAVDSALFYKLGVGTRFLYAVFGQNEDAIGIFDGCKAVRDSKGRSAVRQLFK